MKPYPAGWPVLAGMSASCAEVQGSYIDPNTQHWVYEEFPGKQLGTKYGGAYESAWMAFRLPEQEVQVKKVTATPRVFTITLNADQSLSVRYLIDGEIVSTRSFAKDQWSCGSDGLTITTLDRKGVVMDKLPNDGRTVMRAIIYRLNEHLYVKTTDTTEAWVMKIIPQWFRREAWFRFAVLPQGQQ